MPFPVLVFVATLPTPVATLRNALLAIPASMLSAQTDVLVLVEPVCAPSMPVPAPAARVAMFPTLVELRSTVEAAVLIKPALLLGSVFVMLSAVSVSVVPKPTLVAIPLIAPPVSTSLILVPVLTVLLAKSVATVSAAAKSLKLLAVVLFAVVSPTRVVPPSLAEAVVLTNPVPVDFASVTPSHVLASAATKPMLVELLIAARAPVARPLPAL